MSGAVDLSGLKERATQPPAPAAPAGSAPAGGTGLAPVVDVTEATFQAEVLERSMQVLVVVDLWATWCEPCKQLSPVLEKLAHEGGGNWVLAKIDVDANPGIAQAFGVQSVPTVVALAGGQPLADFAGAQPEAQLREWIAALQQAVDGKLTGPPSAGPVEPEPEDPRFVAAENALEQGDFEGAMAAYRLVLNSEPGNTQAQAALRQVTFLARVQDLPQDVYDTAEAQPDSIDAQFAAADAEMYSQHPEAAFDRLVALVRRTAGDDRTRVRTRLLELFELFDPAEPIVIAARRKLASALY
ncbi:tetratricopeptide repeat protein [Prescottella sp. R16]|uniref:tetratricopeptide repeat protein n=1 Tax=Prescottella sp. R16 TaxID=3064529 RepID=UPI00272ED0D1|nr:tetratricopeptide repeat protein [Prescottella sp. R16]